MVTTKQIELPLWETVKRSFLYTFYNGSLFFKMLTFGVILVAYEVLSGFETLKAFSPDIAAINNEGQATIGSLLNMLVSVAITINYCRFIILKEPVDFGSVAFFKRLMVFFISLMLFSIIITIPMVFAMFVAQTYPLIYLGLIIGLFALVIWMSPIFLFFVGIAIDNKKLNLKEAFTLGDGNRNKIFWGAILMMLPCAVLTILLGIGYTVLLSDSYIVKFLFSLSFIILSIFDTCLKSSFFAHVYQYLTFYKKEKL